MGFPAQELPPHLLAAMGVAAAAGLMRGFAGVGSGMLMAPFFAILFGPVRTVAVIVLMEAVVTAQLLPGVRREIDWKEIAPMGVAAAVFMPAGSWILVSLEPDLIARMIALVVLVFSIVLMIGWRHGGRRKTWMGAGVGAVSGVLMASTSLGNPPVMVYLLSGRDGAAAHRANFTGYFALTLTALIAMMAFGGLIGPDAVWTAALLLPAFMAAAFVGAKLFRKSSETLYRRVALGLLFCVGVYGLLR